MRRGTIAVVVDERRWAPEYMADPLINGFYSHDDRDKRAEFERLFPGIQLLARQQFISYLFETTRVAVADLWLTHVI